MARVHHARADRIIHLGRVRAHEQSPADRRRANLNRLAALRIWMTSPGWAGLCGGGGGEHVSLHLRQQPRGCIITAEASQKLGGRSAAATAAAGQGSKRRTGGEPQIWGFAFSAALISRRTRRRARGTEGAPMRRWTYLDNVGARAVRLAGGGAVAAKPPGARSRSLAGPGVELAARRRELRAASKAKTKSAGGDRCC